MTRLRHRVDRYAERVHAGDIVAGPFVRLVCDRHLEDRHRAATKAGHPLGLVFHQAAADHILEFFEGVLRLPDTLGADGEPVPFVLTPANAFIVGSLFGWKWVDGWRRYREAYVEMGKGNAKALALDTPIPTPNGWTTMAAIQTGDRVFDDRGRVVTVLQTSAIMVDHSCYEVVFDDGSIIVADGEHLWRTEQRTFVGGKGKAIRGIPKSQHGAWRHGVCTTAEIAATLRYPNGKYQSANHSVALAGALATTAAQLPVEPYVFGVWLGDGDADCARITVADADTELLEHVAACGVSIGGRQQSTKHLRTPRYRIGGTGRGKHASDSMNARLRRMGLFEQGKQIPIAYLRAAVDQRLALLQGLMDTDGHIAPGSGRCTITSVHEVLARGISEVVISLGMKCTVRERAATLYGREVSRCWTVGFDPPSDLPVFRLRRKLQYQVVRHHRRRLSGERRIVDVRPVPSVPVKCIAVDTPSHLYLAGRSMIPTHNTPLAAGIGLYGLTMDGEQAAEIYSVASGIDQARICWLDADRMVEASPDLAELIHRGKDNLSVASTYSWFRPLSKEKRGKSGPRPHFVIFDEMHEYADPVVVNKMRAGTKRRKQPLSIGITNSGYDRTTICWQHHEHGRKILEGYADDPRFFPFICSLDEGDDFLQDPSCHAKANPNLGIVIQQDYLDRQVENARHIPSETNMVLRLNGCVWTQVHSPAWDMGKWRTCGTRAITDAELVGRPCYGGLDLGQTDDFAAWVRLWELEGGDLAVKARFWLPRAALTKYPDRPYAEWERAGLLEVTEGDTTDVDLIEDAVLADARTDGVLEIGYDKRFAHQLALHLQGAGLTVVDTPQGYALNESIKSVAKLIADGKIVHGNHLILSWMMDNTVLRPGRNKEVRLDKDAAKEKIDGPSALVMANARRIVRPTAPTYSFFVLGASG